MSILKKPDFEELCFRQKLLADEKTMQYNHAYGGIITFPREKWANWYHRWISDPSPNYFYRYIVDEETGEYVGEAAYYKSPEDNQYFCSIIIMEQYRNRGHGHRGLEALCNAARNNRIKYLYDDIAIDNPSIALFLKSGFEILWQNNEVIRVRKELR